MKTQKPVHSLKTKLTAEHLTPITKRLITLIGLLVFLVGCNQNLGAKMDFELNADFAGADAVSDPVAVEPVVSAVTFADVKANIFVPHCLKCHATDTQRGDVDLERFETAFAVAKLIRDEVAADRMPRRAPPLPPELKAMLFAWIDAGAPEK